MLEAVLAMPGHCLSGYRAGAGTEGLPSALHISAVTLCGMGGSGIAGDVVRALYRARLGVPVDVVKESALPAYCGKDTLVVCSSFSGGTAETLACFEEASARGCRSVVISSGGQITRRARERSAAVVPVDSAFPAPRAAVGFLVFATLGALEAMGVIPPLAGDVELTARGLEGLAAEVGPGAGEGNPASGLARSIGERVPVVWGADGIGAVAATRWKTEMNENAKVPSFSAALPELDHNDVVGWSAGQGERFFLVTLRHDWESPDVSARFAPSIEIAVESGVRHAEFRAPGLSPLSDLMWLVMLGDATSVHLALERRVDPTPIGAIDRIKSALAAGSEAG
jgi:glucose/mannose-6-phosphate isomerase